MAENPVFNINFVKSIEKRPCIWNNSLTEYSKRNLTGNAWVEVSNEVKDSVSNCRARWRNIRGAFLRSLKKPPNGSSSKAKNKYYLNEYLEFLLPYIKNQASDEHLKRMSDCNGTLDNSDSEGHSDTQDEPMESQGDRINQVYDIIDEHSQGSGQDFGIDKSIVAAKTACTSTKLKFTQPASTISNSVYDAFIEWQENKKENDINSKEHPNLSFLRSLLPDMEKMTDKQNRRFRQKVIGLVDDILEDMDIPICQSTTSNEESVSSYVYCPTPSPNEYVYRPTPSASNTGKSYTKDTRNIKQEHETPYS